jgi:23S rRNA pseudouridine1911/1915/1917 synthase
VRIEGPFGGWDRLGLPVLFASEQELAVVKPAGTATELTSDPNGVSLISRVRSAAPRRATPKLPHRLDRVTRGIVVVALSEDAIRFHSEQLRAGAWEKLYLARLAASQAEGLVGLHKLHLRARNGRASVVRSGGKRAITEVLAAAPAADRDDEAHALLRLHTGRYHQIRATMAHLGAPLVGDWLYGEAARRDEPRFYLEHVALRFAPYGMGKLVTLHRRDDPEREAIDPTLRAALDRILAGWEAGHGAKR